MENVFTAWTSLEQQIWPLYSDLTSVGWVVIAYDIQALATCYTRPCARIFEPQCKCFHVLIESRLDALLFASSNSLSIILLMMCLVNDLIERFNVHYLRDLQCQSPVLWAPHVHVSVPNWYTIGNYVIWRLYCNDFSQDASKWWSSQLLPQWKKGSGLASCQATASA